MDRTATVQPLGREVHRTQAYHDEWVPEAATGLYYQLSQLATATTYHGWVEVIR